MRLPLRPTALHAPGRAAPARRLRRATSSDTPPPPSAPPPPSLVLHGRAVLVALADVFSGVGRDALHGPGSDKFLSRAAAALMQWNTFAGRVWSGDAADVDQDLLWAALRPTTPDLADFSSLGEFHEGVGELVETVFAAIDERGGKFVRKGADDGDGDAPPSPSSSPSDPPTDSRPTLPPPDTAGLVKTASLLARDPRTRDRVKAALRSAGGGGDRGGTAAGDGGAMLLLAALAEAGDLSSGGARWEGGAAVDDAAVAALLLRKLQALERK